MSDENVEGDAAKRLLAIVEEIHAAGRSVIGERWTLFSKMKALADEGDLVGMVSYFESCRTDPKGRSVGRKLEAHGKPSLETKETEFLTIALPHICEMLIDARQKWLTPRYLRHRAWLEEAFESYRDKIEQALRDRLRRDTYAMTRRVGKLPFIFLAKSSPPSEVAVCLIEAARCFLYGQYRASVILCRASLEAALRGRLNPPQSGKLAELIPLCRKQGILNERQLSAAGTIKRTGDEAAHSWGDRVDSKPIDEQRATGILVKLRSLIEALY